MDHRVFPPLRPAWCPARLRRWHTWDPFYKTVLTRFMLKNRFLQDPFYKIVSTRSVLQNSVSTGNFLDQFSPTNFGLISTQKVICIYHINLSEYYGR
jgi:hypothetical protein